MTNLSSIRVSCFLLLILPHFAWAQNADEIKIGGTFDVEVIRDVTYYDGEDASPNKHKLDLYLPKGQKDFPVLFFVHGGAWTVGSRWEHGMAGRLFAKNGVGVVLISYRLSPQVQHPGHIQDVARAFAWTHKNIGKHGGRADEIFVSGQSAGGHLAALLATNEEYLKGEQLSLKDIKGVIPISGVYSFRPGELEWVIGEGQDAAESASPLKHVSGKEPPFLIMYAEKEFHGIDKMSTELFAALQKENVQAELVEIKDRNHISLMFWLMLSEADPGTQALLKFLSKHSSLKLTTRKPAERNIAAASPPALAASLELANDPATGGPGKFAAEEIRREAKARGMTLGDDVNATRIVLTVGKERGAAAQGYSIRVTSEGGRRTITVSGADATGAMYGGLDVAEAIRTGTFDALKDSDHRPHIAQRGIKFNIPLDLRTPSYTDCSDAAQANIPEVWEREFWIDYFDAMARHRYNVLSLWSLHPFPSLVKVPEFPEVALDDVWRTRVKLDDTFSFAGTDMVRPAMLANHEVVKRITIDQKIEFWRWVMQQAADRGIRVYFFTWNVFTFGADGKHGITNDLGNDITKKYFRASVREMVKTYPLLAGMGITAGEGMPEKMDSKEKERWLWDTYGEGVRDALKDDPGSRNALAADDPKREFGMIHRFHWTAQSDILNAFKDYPGPFEFSFKYSVAHMYSITKPPFIRPLLENLAPGRKTWLTVRNDDIYTFRFGDPAYAREYILNMPPADKMAGFYMGPDGYVWGRDFLERHPAPGPRPLVMEKQWYSFLLWGRLAYDPSLPDSRFEQLLAARHPKASSPHLFRALQGASQVMPLTTRFFWGDIDLKWFPEACWSHPRSKGKGFYSVRHFMEGSSMPGSEVLCIRDWRARLIARQPMTETTPLEIADALDGAVAQTFASLEALRSAAKEDSELQKTINDCESLAWLGRYYASKIRGACALSLFDASGDKFEHDATLRHLEDALTHWKRYAALRDAHYVPALYNRVGHVDVTALIEKVAADLDIARNWKPGTLKDDGKRAGTERGFRN